MACGDVWGGDGDDGAQVVMYVTGVADIVSYITSFFFFFTSFIF